MTSGSFILKLIGTNHGSIKGVIGNYLSGLEIIDKTLCIGCTKLYPDAIKFRTFSNIKTILTHKIFLLSNGLHTGVRQITLTGFLYHWVSEF